jgi:HAD superfamily hydrolase (TIGR01457 family)
MDKMERLKKIRLFLLDMDGTFYLGNSILPGTQHFVEQFAKDTNRDFAFITNNSSKNRMDYVAKLKRMGFDFPEHKVITSGEATTIYLNQQKPHAKIYLVGTPSLEKEFTDAGFILTEENPDYVVLGFDMTMTYRKMELLCNFVKDGVPYIATHPDFNCPDENGWILPDAGAMIAFVEASTGKRPLVIGKPNRYIIEAASQKFGIPKEEIAMVGDRLYTDIAVGKNAQILTVLVLCGETSLQDLDGSDVQPDFIFQNLGELAEQLC